jgi:hypothetical protein
VQVAPGSRGPAHNLDSLGELTAALACREECLTTWQGMVQEGATPVPACTGAAQ